MTAPTQTRAYLMLDIAKGDTTLPIFTANGTPTNGTTGTLANVAPPGALLQANDAGTVSLYQNTNTKASPTWTLIEAAGDSPSFVSVTTSGINTDSVADPITASTTHSISGATKLTAAINDVTTCANAGDAVGLAALQPGQSQIVFNSGAAAAGVYPASTAYTIDGGSAGAAVTLTNAKRCIYICVAANTIISAQLGIASA